MVYVSVSVLTFMDTQQIKTIQMVQYLRFTFFLLFIILVSCQREDSDLVTPIKDIIEETETFFDSNFIGSVVDESGRAVIDARVTIGNHSDLSSESGTFLFNNAKTNSSGALLLITKTGYYDQYIYLPKAANQFSNLTVTLTKKSDFITFSASSDSELSISSNMQLLISAGSLATMDGQVFGGQAKLYLNKNPIEGLMPIIDKNFKNGVLAERNEVQFTFESADGSALKLIKPLKLTSLNTNLKFGKLSTDKQKWVEVEAIADGNNQVINIEQILPYTWGKFTPRTRVNTRIINSSNQGVSFTKVVMSDDLNNHRNVFPDQNGYVSFYTSSDISFNMTTSDVCGNTLDSKTFNSGIGDVQNLPDIVLDEKDLYVVQSNIDPCGLPISKHDLVNVRLLNAAQNALLYQSETSQSFVMPVCMKVEKAIYYRGKDEKFSVSFSGQNNNKLINISVTPLCIEKISGYFSVNDVPILLNMEQYYIYRESRDQQNVVITDLSGFMISIPGVTGEGEYKPDAVFFNHPSISDCLLEECTDMTVWIDEINQPGQLVKVRVDGKMLGDIIKGDFVNLLKN